MKPNRMKFTYEEKLEWLNKKREKIGKKGDLSTMIMIDEIIEDIKVSQEAHEHLKEIDFDKFWARIEEEG